MNGTGRQWDGAGLERKIRAAGRLCAVDDIAMVADGQWAVGTTTCTSEAAERLTEEAVVEDRVADGQRVELTLEDLARAVGIRPPQVHHDEP